MVVHPLTQREALHRETPAGVRLASAPPAWWLPGCTRSCREVRAIAVDLLRPASVVCHDPAAHEDYGRATADAAATWRGTVRTGPLSIDHDYLSVRLGARVLPLTPRELQIVLLLSTQLGRVFTQNEILAACWGSAYTTEMARCRRTNGDNPNAHLLRVNMTRLRAKLGPYRWLIETRPGIGYGLISVPPEAQP